jgi:L-seryl-tRNA(Ser) seleniumtransferase
MAAAAAGYCVLEVDRHSGERNRRDERLSELLVRLTGAQAGIAVNNNAAAVLLGLAACAHDREVVVSRGELVEIGGSVRIPDVMRSAGVRLVEVGTTNRTRSADYASAISPETALLMKVHRSNFELVGFTEEVSAAELAALGREHGIHTLFDLGSGLIEACGARPLDVLRGETQVRSAVESGIDLVTFSGDKLLGGPQAGLIVGEEAAVERLRAHPVYRALRCDKVALAGLEATLELLLAGRGDELPARAMLLADPADLEQRAVELARGLARISALEVSVEAGESEPGSGSAPGVTLPTCLVRLRHVRLSARALAARLRDAEPPVFARIHEDALLLDPRTLLEGEAARLVSALELALASTADDTGPHA